jgi:hypothetical protein
MTPKEYEEEQDLYHSWGAHSSHVPTNLTNPRSIQFVDRILTAISRFERTRKLTPERRNIFYKYLAFGGLTVGPNVGQGGLDLSSLSKVQAAQALSQVFASEDKRDLDSDTALYDVDFLGCMHGFLSRRARDIFGFETREVCDTVCSTLERFMDYLLQHDVCPEYEQDIHVTRFFLRAAPQEIWDLTEAGRRLPGEFNIACSTVFGGTYAKNYDGETWWGSEEEANVFVGMKEPEATEIVKLGISGVASPEVYEGYARAIKNNEMYMLEVIAIEEQIGLEVTKMEPPTKEVKKMYFATSNKFRPMGTITVKPWKNPDAAPEDLTPEEAEAAETAPIVENKVEYTFVIEEILQNMLRVGTKFECDVHILRCGLTFIDTVHAAYPSFDEFLANELMVDWKAPKPKKGALDYVSGEDSDDEHDDEGAEEDDGSHKKVKNVNSNNGADEIENDGANAGGEAKDAESEATVREEIGAMAKDALTADMQRSSDL